MRAEKYTLVNQQVKNNAIKRLAEIEPDGKVQVTFSGIGTKTARQRGLQFLWYTNVAESGMGGRHEETKDSVHRFAKFKFGLPILLREDEFFTALYNAWVSKYGDNREAMAYFIDNHVHTEKFTVSQMAEYLTEFQHYYSSNDVPLANPDDMGLLRG